MNRNRLIEVFISNLANAIININLSLVDELVENALKKMEVA